ncbi:helix-turn-helix transcriptional regulator [Aurantibacter crassamenti]|uniref:helix-turn-helix domain-containing protein n=1 Tax=Aurantibacter crassamenti TaxID=1837375 RepID=UPI001939F3B0|nr:AraC family transcriptional regulator [Aurantibacter crassamenti]MBM1104578.1 helix-turn-helix transcriptional regulator [Aurantibacter crassamenti]
MKTIKITSTILEVLFEQLQAQLGGTFQNSSKEFSLELNNGLAKGFITGNSTEEAISYIEYDITFNEDVVLVHESDENHPIQFSYCSKGQLMQSFGTFGKKYRLGQFQTGIISNASKQNTCLHFRKDEEVKVSMIQVDADEVNDEDLKFQLQNTFAPNTSSNTFAYVGSFNLKIAERIQQLDAVSQKGIVRNLLINGLVYLILALEIQQHTEDMANAESNNGSLTKKEMEDVNELSELIRNYPEIQYSLKYLSKKSGLSPFKLQEGFKALHGRTVSDFVRNVRVEAAEKLIRTSDLNISEVVYTVGLTSRSYFSKIFKEKYNCSPKHYQNHQNSMAVTA